jgi:predicted DNA-binding transcriptional regulator AlpA
MNEPLITIHGASSLLGITKAALMKLVKADQVPYVKLPGKAGEVRFVGIDLQNWINSKKGGVMPATARMTERQGKQEHLRKRPEYAEQLKEVKAKMDALQIKIDAGELTARALDPHNRRWHFLRDLIGKIDNQFRNDLMNSCPCEDLRDEWAYVSELKISAYTEIASQKKTLERIENNIRLLKTDIERLVDPKAAGVHYSDFKEYTHDDAYQARIDTKKRELRVANKSKARCEQIIHDLELKLEEHEAEKQRIKQEMIDYQED